MGQLARDSQKTHTECLYSVVDVSNNSITVYNGPCLLFGLHVTTALSAHACPVKDNATTIASLAASAAIGTNLAFPGVRCETSLVVDPDDAATGIITVFYLPL